MLSPCSGHRSKIIFHHTAISMQKVKLARALLLSITPRRRMGSKYTDPCFPDLGNSWRWEVSVTQRSFYPRENMPRYPSDSRLGAPQSRTGQYGDMQWTYQDTNSEHQVIHPAASRYNDYTTEALTNCMEKYIITQCNFIVARYRHNGGKVPWEHLSHTYL
jgi:hypothetical protein